MAVVNKKVVTPPTPDVIKEAPNQQQAKQPIDAGVPTVTPDGKVDGRDYSQLKNPNQSLTRFGDDSSADQYANNLGGQAEKYTGEGVKTSDVAYNPDIKTADLDPNYKYGWQAQLYGSQNDGYVSQRNDNIASALYNEGKTSKEDIRAFLEAQKGFFDSTEGERNNTIESIWKRLGTYPAKEEAGNSEEKKDQVGFEGQDMSNLGANEEGGKLYGKNTADEGNPKKGIVTEVDPNSIQNQMLEARQAKVKALRSMDSKDVATSIYYGTSPYGDQAMRDLMEVDPNKYMEIQNELRYLKGENDINSIAKTGTITGNEETITATETVNNDADQWLDSNTNERNKDQVKTDLQLKMEQNQTAKTATEEMNNINKLISEYQQKLDDLPNEAKKAFKNDVPQYLYDAYIANRTQEYQSEINKLQSRYNSAIDLYKTELANTQWQMEYNLKSQEAQADINYKKWSMAFQQNQEAFNQNYRLAQLGLEQQKIDLSKIHWENGIPYTITDDGKVAQLTPSTVNDAMIQEAQRYLSNVKDGDFADECEVFSDKFAEAVYGVKMNPVNIQTGEISEKEGATTALQKRWYVNTPAELPKVGTVAVFDYTTLLGYTPYQKKRGHTMVVESIDPETGLVTLVGSNKKGEKQVYRTTTTVSELKRKGLVGYWDPMKDQRIAQTTTQGYTGYGNTPMLETFDRLRAGDLNADQKKELAIGESFYNMMYAMKEEGLIDALLDSPEWKKVIADIQKADFSKSGDDQGSAFLDTLSNSIKNNIKGDEISMAVNRFQVMVKDLLRKESGAAINSGEWKNYFSMYIPSASDTGAMSLDKLYLWDDTIFNKLRGTGKFKQSDYVPLFRDGAYTPKTTTKTDRTNNFKS